MIPQLPSILLSLCAVAMFAFHIAQIQKFYTVSGSLMGLLMLVYYDLSIKLNECREDSMYDVRLTY